jgi:hypothetical protein
MTRTEGEMLFETYLKSQKIIQFEFEKNFPGKSKHPDYCVTLDGKQYLFEVKDFSQRNLPSSGQFAPEPEIRKRIDEARAKFREFKEYACALVLFNNSIGLLDLTSPMDVLGAMYGDVAIQMDVNITKGAAVPNSERSVFTTGGKMVNPKTGSPQNTTISALITLRHTTRTKCGERHLGVIFWDNHLASIRFPPTLFCGPFDEHFSLTGAEIGRTFIGSGLLESA